MVVALMISIGNCAPDNGGECSALVSLVPPPRVQQGMPPVIKAAIGSVTSSTHSVHMRAEYHITIWCAMPCRLRLEYGQLAADDRG